MIKKQRLFKVTVSTIIHNFKVWQQLENEIDHLYDELRMHVVYKLKLLQKRLIIWDMSNLSLNMYELYILVIHVFVLINLG
jgi:hypothetical protein